LAAAINCISKQLQQADSVRGTMVILTITGATMDDGTESDDMIDVPALAAALRAAGLGGALGGVQHMPFGSVRGAMSRVTRYRLIPAASPTDLPHRVIVKRAPADDGIRQISATLELARRESAFYRELAPTLGVPTPRCFGMVPQRDGSLALVLEDLGAMPRGDRVAGCSPAVARRVVLALAQLHAAHWGSAALGARAWLAPFDTRALQRFARDAWPVAAAVLDPVLTPTLRRLGGRLGDCLAGWFDAYWRAPWTLLHNDVQLDNIFFPSDTATPLLIDWQSCVRGRGPLDVAGFLGGNLSIATRRAIEWPILREYHQALCAAGVTGYSFEACWNEYRRGMLDGLSRMVIALASALDDGQHRQHRDVFWPRYAAAAEDLQLERLVDG
jgi:aminoglycoside phosphotransferase (APT) family kinase protein